MWHTCSLSGEASFRREEAGSRWTCGRYHRENPCRQVFIPQSLPTSIGKGTKPSPRNSFACSGDVIVGIFKKKEFSWWTGCAQRDFILWYASQFMLSW